MKTILSRSALVLSAAAMAIACNKAPDATPTPTPSAKPQPTPAVTAAANAPFEGEILVNVNDDASKSLPKAITYDVKGSKVRYAPASAPLHAVGDLDAQRVYAIDDAKKAYDSIDTKPVAGAKPVAAPKVTKSGKMEKVAGLDCEDWTIDDGTEKAEVCAAKGIAYVDLASDAKPGNAQPAWATALTAEKAFPMRVIMHDKAGKEQYRAEATKADAKKLDDAMFQLPKGYQAADLAKETKTASLP